MKADFYMSKIVNTPGRRLERGSHARRAGASPSLISKISSKGVDVTTSSEAIHVLEEVKSIKFFYFKLTF